MAASPRRTAAGLRNYNLHGLVVQPQIQRRGTGTCGAYLCPRALREPSPNGLSRAVGPAAGCCQQCPLYWYFSIVRCACHIFGRSLHPILVHITPPCPASCKFNRRDSRFCSPPPSRSLPISLSLGLSLSVFSLFYTESSLSVRLPFSSSLSAQDTMGPVGF